MATQSRLRRLSPRLDRGKATLTDNAAPPATASARSLPEDQYPMAVQQCDPHVCVAVAVLAGEIAAVRLQAPLVEALKTRVSPLVSLTAEAGRLVVDGDPG